MEQTRYELNIGRQIYNYTRPGRVIIFFRSAEMVYYWICMGNNDIPGDIKKNKFHTDNQNISTYIYTTYTTT